MLKWTASAFALAATLQLGLAPAQDSDATTDLIPPGPTEIETEADVDRPDQFDDRRDERDVPRSEQPGPPIAGEEVEQNDLRRDEDLRDNAPRDLPDEGEIDDRGVIQRESGDLPDAAVPQDDLENSDPEISDRVRAATANLDIDDATRSRYRWHQGEWWFQTKSGGWKYHRDGEWRTFDPTTYQAPRPGVIYSDGGASGYAPSSGTFPQSGYSGRYGVPQTYSPGGYYYGNRPITTMRQRGVYRPDSEFYDGRYYRGGYGGRVYGDRYGRPGYGYGQGYNPNTDRYYGYGPGGRYSIDGDRYRGGMIGSQIGGQIGGRSGAIIGGAIGAEAAD